MHRFAGLTAALLMLAPAVMSQEKGAAVEKELTHLKGKWKQYSSVTKGNEVVLPANVPANIVTIDGNRWIIDGPMGKIEQTFKIDPRKTPKEIDRISTTDDGKEVVDPCIYKLDGDTLTIYSSRTPDLNGKLDAGTGRPKDFDTSKSGFAGVLKRVKE